MNLNTFVMIPSRHNTPSPADVVFDFSSDDDDEYEDLYATHTSAVDVGGRDSSPSPMPASSPQFRLCFEQPFADQQRFQLRLHAQKVCLENVRVEDWTSDGSSSSSSSSSSSNDHNNASSSQPSPQSSDSSSPPVLAAVNSVVLCTIRVCNLHPPKLVYAWCTDNDWLTVTRIPAYPVGGCESLGYKYDRFCFAVRRPSFSSVAGGPFESQRPHTKNPCGIREAVDFTLCFEADGETFIDDNEGVNYRIEWF
jgi:hypothetical protein